MICIGMHRFADSTFPPRLLKSAAVTTASRSYTAAHQEHDSPRGTAFEGDEELDLLAIQAT